ncbi:hypothetical protein JYB87_10375 [Shewanella avicenniae]|uniref:Uncharacterized protein n=1 Tax=Shewanella avicenniae TaxID=2814294 RepID=A0ABX7QL57_9GAMM|nr:hypothetical protein [Shewanella avicenniae]QSX32187.1 hypothetical protein JYB87_10375 [Shewanella avicenniae]
MTKLTKEDVISQLEAALSKREGSAVSIEQSGSWYKIDGGKSVRFAELETMLPELSVSDANPVTKTATPQSKPVAKGAAIAATGKTPKQLWREKLAKKPGSQLPRGF